MRSRLLLPVLIALALLVPATSAGAAPMPAWKVHSIPLPTNFAPGTSGEDFYEVTVENVGGGSTSGAPLTVTDTLPPGLAVTSIRLPLAGGGGGGLKDVAGTYCETAGAGAVQTVTCTIPAELETRKPALLGPSEHVPLVIGVAVPPSAAGTLVNFAQVEGGGAAAAQSSSQNVVSQVASASGVGAFEADLAGEEGQLVSQAGSQPFQYSTYFSINTELPPPNALNSPFVPAGGDAKDIEVKLPPGLIGNPTVVPPCSMQQFNASLTLFPPPQEGSPYIVNECPNGSAIGLVAIQGLDGAGQVQSAALYNLVPPPGEPALLGFRISGAYFLIDTSVRTGSDYGITASLRNVSEIKRITAAAVTIWGPPAADSHDTLRGVCAYPFGEYRPFDSLGSCSAEVAPKPFIQLPTSCARPLTQTFSFDTYSAPGSFASKDSATTDRDGNPIGVEGCNRLEFTPTISSQPTTNVADSPTGLEFNLHQPQDESYEGLSTASLKDAKVSLPEGVAVNPSAANGLSACSSAQAGLTTPIGQSSPIHFSEDPQTCPAASKLGTVEVSTPLLDHKLPGSIYAAKPYENPFGSLLAIYLAVEDEQSGIIAKLAGKVEANPVTGQLTATFSENPELPLEDTHLSFFNGAGAVLKTPSTCGKYTTTSDLTPWSTPEGVDAAPSDSFQTSVSASGSGACPSSEAQAPNSPTFSAGTISPLAGAYSPFVLHIARKDGTQHITGIETSLPAGLTGKLAGIPYCPQSGIDQAIGREAPEKGREEQSSPSCPAASEVGTVQVGAGAGISPYYVDGHAYLAGPYKGASLSLVVIVPAVAGPFDLGTVVDRVALNVGEYDARIHAVADPLPTIRDGIPLDVRSIELKLDRPGFTLNPTSCEVKAIEGSVSTQAGQSAPLKNSFQVGECSRLAFQPKLAISLKGPTKRTGHPALRAVVTYPKAGAYANISRAQVSLPQAEFLDQGNIGKSCTKPVLAAGACPAKSIYGKVRAWTPLLERPLEGPVYLVGGYGYKLPALVAELNGQIKVLLVGKVDTDKQKGIRSTFEAVPDAPVEKFVLEMKGGKKYGLLENSENICRKEQKAGVAFSAQNGRAENLEVKIADSCGKGAKKHKKAGKGRKGNKGGR